MNSLISKLIAATGIGLMLGGCASIGPTPAERDRLEQIHSGLTQDEVRRIAGRPANVTRDTGAGGALWIYSYTDTWGYPSEFDVSFTASGEVESTYSERLDY